MRAFKLRVDCSHALLDSNTLFLRVPCQELVEAYDAVAVAVEIPINTLCHMLTRGLKTMQLARF